VRLAGMPGSRWGRGWSEPACVRQCLELGLLDEVMIDLVPVVMGKGRPFFGELSLEDVPLNDPTVCIQGKQVTHLVFPVAHS
jgi:dihydrofolate reductase